MTMRWRAWFAGVMVGAVALTASAQTRPRHEGFNAALGIGFGKLGTSCSGCTLPARDGAFQATIRGGWTLSDAFIIAGEGLIFQKHLADNVTGETFNTNYTVLTAEALWYPSRRWDIFFKGGAGVSNIQISLHTPLGVRRVKATAPALRIGIGIDMRFGRTWSLSPYLDYLLGLTSGTNIDGLNIRSSMLLFGAAVTWP